jgi:hypothetical protein
MDTIELSEFIKSTLINVATGVKEANAALKNTTGRADDFFILQHTKGDSKGKGIAFDIAISASKSQKDKAGFMVALATIGGGANVEKGAGNEMMHRIKFEVGLSWNLAWRSSFQE